MSLYTAEQKAHMERMEKLQRLRHMMDAKKAEISRAQLELEALESLHTDFTYLEEN